MLRYFWTLCSKLCNHFTALFKNQLIKILNDLQQKMCWACSLVNVCRLFWKWITQSIYMLFTTARHEIIINKRPRTEAGHNKSVVCIKMSLNWSQQNHTIYILCVITHYWSCLKKMQDSTLVKCNRMVRCLESSYCCIESPINILQFNIKMLPRL